jgi:alkylation response protein AidB-like acyl-CoA dehydrogenase
MAESVASARGFSTELWKEISVLGWPGLLLPAEYGGSGGTMVDVVLLLEEMGRACFPSPCRVRWPPPRSSWAPRLGAPRALCSLPWPPARADLCARPHRESASIDEGLRSSPASWGASLDGRKLFVNDAHVADDLVVVTRGVSGVNLFLLDAAPGRTAVSPMEAMAGDRPCEVVFAGVDLKREDLLGGEGRGWECLGPALQAGALARAAEMVGCAQRILELCVDHARGRRQFGRPLGSFQAIQHACADLLRDVETARYLVYGAAWRMEQGHECGADVAMATAYAGRTSQAVARRAHQLLGAISFCEEHSLHLYHKRILAAGLDFGDPSHHLETVASSLGLA